MNLSRLSRDLKRRSGLRLVGQAQAVAGGSINRAFRAQSEQGLLFVKTNSADGLSMFEAEAAGLEALACADAVRVPAVKAVGAVAATAYLVLEWIEFGAKDEAAERELGRRLASQHRKTRSAHGWYRDNTIGSTPQINTPSNDWLEFFCERRLRFQLELAAGNGLSTALHREIESLLRDARALYDGYEPAASLLHGDLWGGNWSVTTDGTPVVFDPAVYFGDRETDLAMTRLFGGFGAAFYEAYTEQWPLAPGWERRVSFYNLYHLLNHFNLFGGGYLASVRTAAEALRRALI